MNWDDMGPDRADRIFLRDHVVELYIGAFAEERGARQRVAFSIVVDVHESVSAHDDVDLILSYDEILAAIDHEIGRSRVDLLETLAEGISDNILGHAQAARAWVRIKKLDRVSGNLGVEVIRSGDGTGRKTAQGQAPGIYCLAPGLGWPDLNTGPNIVAIEGAQVPICGDAVADRRVALLAAEQEARLLAAQNPETAVVATSTELDYAIRNNLSVVWAPSKMVFDALESPYALPTNFGARAVWLAELLGANSLTFVGRLSAYQGFFNGNIREVAG